MPTERLYYHDSRLLEFDARVTAVTERDGGFAVTLDRTAFYPTGGGQPNDTGVLGSARVIDCIDADDEEVLHLVEGNVPRIGETIHGQVDWRRRLDHLQQHTGQHILSAAFVRELDAPTRSFRVLEQDCEIDVALDNPSDEKIEAAVDLANRIIWENRSMQIRQVSAAEAAALPLRKEPARAGELRVIEIEDFDLTPCGGTHARSTGEVGVIAVRNWERAKGLTRIHFMAGIRVLADYRKANRTAREVAELFSSSREDSPALLTRLIEENKKLRRRIGDLEVVASKVEAEELVKAASSTGEAVIVARVFDDRDAESLKRLALALIAHSRTIALLGSRDGDAVRLVFARSPDASGDMNALMRAACEMVEGRGGGKADIAQGGGRNAEKLEAAIDSAARMLS